MSLQEQYKRAHASGKLESVTARWYKMENKNDFILGRLLARNQVSSRLGSSTYMQYLFETDQGMIKTSLGGAADAEVGPLMKEGEVYMIIYQGKEDLSGGRSINRYVVQHVPQTEEEGQPGENEQQPPGDSEIPF